MHLTSQNVKDIQNVGGLVADGLNLGAKVTAGNAVVTGYNAAVTAVAAAKVTAAKAGTTVTMKFLVSVGLTAVAPAAAPVVTVALGLGIAATCISMGCRTLGLMDRGKGITIGENSPLPANMARVPAR